MACIYHSSQSYPGKVVGVLLGNVEVAQTIVLIDGVGGVQGVLVLVQLQADGAVYAEVGYQVLNDLWAGVQLCSSGVGQNTRIISRVL